MTTEKKKEQNDGPISVGNCAVISHITIRDKDTGEVLVKKRG